MKTKILLIFFLIISTAALFPKTAFANLSFTELKPNPAKRDIDIHFKLLGNSDKLNVGLYVDGKQVDHEICNVSDCLYGYTASGFKTFHIPKTVTTSPVIIKACLRISDDWPKNNCDDPSKVLAHLDVPISDAGSTTGVAGDNPCQPKSGATLPTCNTAIGNIDTDPQTFVTRVLGIAIGLAGGIALILMVIGSIRIAISSGDPQKVNAGREMIVAAIAGLLFLIFSVLILRFVGLNFLGF